MLSLNVFPVSAVSVNCIDENLILGVNVSKWLPLIGFLDAYICIFPLATVKIRI